MQRIEILVNMTIIKAFGFLFRDQEIRKGSCYLAFLLRRRFLQALRRRGSWLADDDGADRCVLLISRCSSMSHSDQLSVNQLFLRWVSTHD